MIENDVENDVENGPKMATVNTLGRKYLENDAKMHFAYLRQCSAYSNSTSKDLTIFFLHKFRV
jgi:hypothetical protein